MYRRSTLKSFTFAFEGIVYVLRTQRNMKIHFTVAFLVMGGSLFFDLSRTELIALMMSITFVLVAEMVNTAVEAAIDTFGTAFDPMAKIAKATSLAIFAMGSKAVPKVSMAASTAVLTISATSTKVMLIIRAISSVRDRSKNRLPPMTRKATVKWIFMLRWVRST